MVILVSKTKISKHGRTSSQSAKAVPPILQNSRNWCISPRCADTQGKDKLHPISVWVMYDCGSAGTPTTATTTTTRLWIVTNVQLSDSGITPWLCASDGEQLWCIPMMQLSFKVFKGWTASRPLISHQRCIHTIQSNQWASIADIEVQKSDPLSETNTRALLGQVQEDIWEKWRPIRKENQGVKRMRWTETRGA